MEVGRQTAIPVHMRNTRSLNLGDLFKVREESGRRETLTIGSIIGLGSDSDKREIAFATEASRRSLLDVIREEVGDAATFSNFLSHHSGARSHGKASWKFVRDRILLRRGSAPSVSSPNTTSISTAEFISPTVHPGSGDEIIPTQENRGSLQSANENLVRNPARMDLAAALAAEREHRRAAEASLSPARVSLMMLMERTESCCSASRSKADEDTSHMEENGRGVECLVCCVCMVERKGAAFIPCGHTFCRACSRELWISRGSCPLCNAFIQEILAIF